MAGIYITDLAAYNEGNPDGFWLDIEDLDADEIKDSIKEFLEKQSVKYKTEREEYFVTDYDDIPTEFGEYPDIDELVEYMEQVGEFSKGVVDAAKVLGVSPETYYGEYDSLEEFGREYADGTGLFVDDKSGVMEMYFDFESYGNDTLINGFSEENGFYFSV